MKINTEEAIKIVQEAAVRAGASSDVAFSLAQAVVAAEWAGKSSVGFSHLLDYLNAFSAGRISGNAEPEITTPSPSMIRVDAKYGIAQLGFDRAFNQMKDQANLYGITVFSQKNSYTVGELGYYTRRLAEVGLVAFAACNSTAHVTTVGSGQPAFGTNPVSFAAPVANSNPFVIDQASSATAFVNVRQAAERGEAIPDGWAINEQGNPTTDASEAVNGLLLAFGGARGANIAFIVEILAAGLTGANWSIDAPSFSEGNKSPGIGLFVAAFKPDFLVPEFSERLSMQLQRFSSLGIHIPGRHSHIMELDIPDALINNIISFQH